MCCSGIDWTCALERHCNVEQVVPQDDTTRDKANPILRKEQSKRRYAALLSIYSAPGVRSFRNSIQNDFKSACLRLREKWKTKQGMIHPSEGSRASDGCCHGGAACREERRGVLRSQQGLWQHQQARGSTVPWWENGCVFPSNNICGIGAEKGRGW